MSTTIDQKVVEMRFDNKLFEKNVATSMSTIDKLKQKLNFSNTTKGLEKIQYAAKKCDMQPLSKSVEVVKMKFSALEVAGITAIQNITNTAINAGERIVSALTIDPAKTGFQEYETQINAVQTILANTSSKGTTLEQVNNALDELNHYADMTIYNFTEMTRNIGTFTAAGVDLNTSVQAIKGIANLAAVSGSTSQQASTAMYQLSQALAAGTVKLQDWNSVVNAGMGGQVFQDALKETAKVHGIAIDQMIKDEGSFRETLSKGWLTSDILTETLSKFTGDLNESQLRTIGYTDEQIKSIMKMGQTANDAATKVKTFTQLFDTLSEAAQSGWTSSWEIMIGDFEKAKERLTKLSDTFSNIINNSANRRNTILEGAFSSNWDVLIQKINGAGIETEKFQNKVVELANKHNVNLADMIAQEGSFEKALKKCFSDKLLNKSILKDALKELVNNMTGTTEATEKMTVSMEKYGEIVNKVICGEFGDGEKRLKALKEAGYDYATVQNLVNEKLGSSVKHLSSLNEEQLKNADNLSKLSEEQLKNEGYTQDQINALKELSKEADTAGTSISDLIDNIEKPSGAELIWDSIFNVIDGITKSVSAVKKAWNDTFHKGMSEDEILKERANQLYGIINTLHKLTENIKITDETADKISRTFKGIFAIFNIITSIVGGGLTLAFRGISLVLKSFDMDILDVTAKMGDFISKIKDFIFENEYIIKGINMFANAIKIAYQWTRQWIENFLKIPEVQINLKNAEQALNRFSNYISGGIKEIEAFIKRIKSMDNISLKDLNNIFKDFNENVIGYFLNINVKFEDTLKSVLNVKNAMINNFSILGSNLEEVKNKIFNIFDSIGKKIRDNIGLGELLTVGIGASMILTVKKLGEVIDKFSAPFEAISNIADSFSEVLESCQKAINSFALKTKSQALLNIAISVGILAASLVALTLVDQSKLLGAAGALLGLSVGLLGVSAAMGVISKIGGGKGTASMLGISASLLILIKVLKSMETLDKAQLEDNIKVLLVLATGISLITGALSLIAPQLSKGSITLLAMSAALKIIVGALKDLDSIEFNNLERSIKIISGAMLGLATIALLCRNVKFGASASILATVVALKIFVDAFDKILSMDTNKIRSNIESLIVILGSFATIMIASSFAGKYAASAGIGILAMSTALMLISLNLKLLSGMDKYDLQKASDTVAKIMLVFAAVVAASKFAGKNGIQAGIMIGMMSGAILLLTGSITILSHMQEEDLNKAIKIIGKVMLMFSVLIAATGLAKDCKSNLIVMAVTLGLLTVALAGLSMIDEESVQSATKAISSVMGMFALIIASTKFSKKATSTIVSMAGTISILGGIIVILSKLPIESVLSSAASLSLLLVSLSASMILMGKAGGVTPKAYLAMGSMLLVVSGVATLISILASENPENVLSIAQNMSLLLISLSVSCFILSNVKNTGASSLAGIATMVGIVVAMGALMVGIGALAEYYPAMEEFLNKGIKLLSDIGYGIGSFIGNIIGGFTSGIFSGLPTIGTYLSDFATNLEPFFNGMRNVDTTIITGAKNLAETILILSAAEFINGISSWLLGDTDWSKFGDSLSDFGKSIVEFSKNADGIDQDKIKVATEAGKAIAEMANSIPNEGGFISLFSGDNGIGTFGKNLVSFGESLKSYSDCVVNVQTGVIISTSNAVESLIEIQKRISYDNLFENALTLSKFGNELSLFGNSFRKYYNYISDIDGNVVASSILQMKSVINTINNMGEINISGANQFEEALHTLGNNGVKQFTSAFKESSSEVISSVSNMLGYVSKGISLNEPICSNEISNLIKSMEMKFQNGYDIFKIIGENLISNIKEGVNTNKNDISSILTNCINNAIHKMREQYDKFKATGKYLVRGFADGMKANEHLIKSAANSIANTAINTLKNNLEIHSPSKVTEKIGSFVGQGFVNGISGFKDEAFNVASVVADKAKDGFSSKNISVNDMLGDLSGNSINTDAINFKDSTNKIGTSIVSGISEGVETSTDDLKKTITDSMINGVLNPVSESIDELTKDSLFGTDAANKLANAYALLTDELENTDGIRKADVLIYEYGKTLYKESEQYKKDSENIKEHRTELKKLVEQRNSLQKQLSTQSKQGTKEAEKQVTDIKSQLEKLETSISSAYDKIKEDENSMIEHMKETYTSFRTTISDTLKSSMEPLKTSLDTSVDLLKSGLNSEIDIFNEFNENSETTRDTVLTNMEAQIKGIKNWQKNLERLSDRGLEQGLIDKLTEMGTSGIGYVNAFVSMSSKEIKQANADFQNSVALSDSMTINKILNNMESQVTSVIKWNNDLKTLSEKGFATGLLNKLKELGVSGADYVKAFMSMTDEEMKRANDSFQESSRLTAQTLLSNFENSLNETKDWVKNIQRLTTTGLNSELVESLSKMGVSSSEYVNAFLSMTSKEIEQFNKSYAEYLSLPTDAADTLISTFASNENQISKTFGNILANSLNDSSNELSLKSTEMGTTVINNLSTALQNGNSILSDKATTVGNVIYDGINTFVSEKNGRYLGSMICKGLSGGLLSGKNSVVEIARQVAYAAYEAAKSELDINSPSKKFWSLGNFSIMGFLNGFTNNEDKIISVVKNLGKNMVEHLSNTASTIADVMDIDTDFNPTIRPVLDLSNIEAGKYKMNSLFDKNYTTSMAIGVSKDINFSKSHNLNSNENVKVRPNNITFTQNNYSPKALSRIDIYRQTKNQFSMMKGAIDRI